MMKDWGLSERHNEQVRLFLRFFRNKRESALRVLENEFEDAKNDSLVEEMYTKSDVEDILDGLRKVIRENFRSELSKNLNMGVLILKQIYEEAERQGIDLDTINVHTIEDQALLEEVERIRLDAALKTVSTPVKASKLVSLKDEHNRLASEAAKAEESSKQLQERFQRLQAQCSDVLREKAALAEELDRLRRQLDEASEAKEEAKGSSAREGERVTQLQSQVSELRATLRSLEEENAKRLAESKQFQQLKRLMMTKNEQILDLRRRLSHYEPEGGSYKEEDDDDG